MTTTIRILALALSAWLSAGCAYWFDTSKPSEAKRTTKPATAQAPAAATVVEVPPAGETIRLKGSTTVGADLAPKLAAAFLASVGATEVTTRQGTKAENHVKVAGLVKGSPLTFDIEYPGSDVAFDCLKAGSCDVGMSSRPIQADEADKLKELGDMTSAACEHVLAMDGIAVIVNRQNKLNKLTVQQIGAIFAGETRSWDKVGGAPKEIHVVTRDKKSGTYDTFVQFATKGRDVVDGAKVVDDSEALAAAVAKDDAAIGFVGLPYVADTKPLAVQDGDAAAIVPTQLTVGTEDYAFSRRLFFYTPEKPRPLVAQFVDFALAEGGQSVVPQTGFISLNIRSAGAQATPDAPEAYVKATNGAQRLSFNFRFKGVSARLDPRSVKDLERLARFIKVTSSNARSVALLGFSDDQANDAKNVEVSRQRALAVAEQLRKRGVDPQSVEGLGNAMPLSTSDRGRARNRRVEVWLR